MQLNNFFASFKQISFYALPMSRYCKRPFWFTFYVIENLLSFPSLGSNLWVLIPLIISAFKLYSNPLLISRQNICEIFPILAFVKMENRLCKFVLFNKLWTLGALWTFSLRRYNKTFSRFFAAGMFVKTERTDEVFCCCSH